MAAVVDIQTAARFNRGQTPNLVLIESSLDSQRVYLRRRIIAALVSLALIGVLLLGVSRVVSSMDRSVTRTRVHVVQPDDTLWSIARAVRPGNDPRSTIAIMVELNTTSDHAFDPWSPLGVGQRIRVPSGS